MLAGGVVAGLLNGTTGVDLAGWLGIELDLLSTTGTEDFAGAEL